MPLFMHRQNLHLPEMAGSSSDWWTGALWGTALSLWTACIHHAHEPVLHLPPLFAEETVLSCSLSGLSCGSAARADGIECLNQTCRADKWAPACEALPVVHQLLHHLGPNWWGMLQEVHCTGSWPAQLWGYSSHCRLIITRNCLRWTMSDWRFSEHSVINCR